MCARDLRDWETSRSNTEVEDLDSSRDSGLVFLHKCSNFAVLEDIQVSRDTKNLTGCSPGQSALADCVLSRGAGLADVQTTLSISPTLWFYKGLQRSGATQNTNVADRLSFLRTNDIVAGRWGWWGKAEKLSGT